MVDSRKVLPATDSPAYQHNVNTPFHQLPAELMLEIIDHVSMDDVSVLTMRLVCRDFYALFEPPFLLGPSERHRFKAALRRDDGAWLSRWEAFKGLVELSKATCSACSALHSKEQFSAEELAKDPNQRICQGALETVKMFRGEVATFNDICSLDLHRMNKEKGFTTYISKSSSLPVPEVTPFLETVIFHAAFERQIHLTYHFRLLTIPRMEPLSVSAISGPFRAIKHLLCRSLPVPWLLSANEAYTEVKFKRTSGPYSRYNFIMSPCCCMGSKSDCSSEYCLHRRKSERHDGMDEVILTVSKSHCDWDDAHPAWADRFVGKWVRRQHELNSRMGEETHTWVYRAKEKGEWNRYDERALFD